jgi:hypothetical protein
MDPAAGRQDPISSAPGGRWLVQPPSTGKTGAGDIAGLRIGEQQRGAREFLGRGPAAQRDLRVEEAPDVRVVIDPVVQRRARPISGNQRSCASSSAENTSLVATGAPSPEDQTPTENTYLTQAATRTKTG